MQIIAHRGASYDAPENTLAAVRLAWEQSADAVEVDVHLTRDGRLAVIHDEDLQRTAGDARRVADVSAAELAGLDAGRWRGPKFAGEPVPLLDDVLAAVAPGRRLFVEIKGGPEVVAALERSIRGSRLPLRKVAVISFDRLAAQAARQALPGIEAAWVVDTPAKATTPSLPEILAETRRLGLDAIDFSAAWPLEDGLLQQVHGAGLKAYVWTVDSPARARRLEAAGLDGVTTNRPGWLRAQLHAHER